MAAADQRLDSTNVLVQSIIRSYRTCNERDRIQSEGLNAGSRPRWACPSGALTGQLESVSGSHSASVGLVPTGRRLVS